jgi:hypothetical protein
MIQDLSLDELLEQFIDEVRERVLNGETTRVSIHFYDALPVLDLLWYVIQSGALPADIQRNVSATAELIRFQIARSPAGAELCRRRSSTWSMEQRNAGN